MARSLTLRDDEREFHLRRLATHHLPKTFTLTSITDCVGHDIPGTAERQRFVNKQLLKRLRKDGHHTLWPGEERAAASEAKREREQRASDAFATIEASTWRSDLSTLPYELAEFASLYYSFEPFPTKSRPSQDELDVVSCSNLLCRIVLY